MSQQINLIARAVRPERRRATTLLLSAVAVAVVSAALAGTYAQYQLRRSEAEAKAVALDLKQAQERHEQFDVERRVRGHGAARESELNTLVAQVKRRRRVVEALKSGVLGSNSGFSPFMRAFSRQTVSGVWLTGFDIGSGGKDLSLSGRALAADLVPRYVEGLNRESLMQGRQFSAMRIEQAAAQQQTPASAPPLKRDEAEKQPRAAHRYVDFSLSTSAGESEVASIGRGTASAQGEFPPATRAPVRAAEQRVSPAAESPK